MPFRFESEPESETGADIAANPARIAEGWEKRFVAAGPRADEMVQLYEQLGFEVLVEPLRPEQLGAGCDDCQVVLLLQYRMIYTRRRPSPGA